MGTRRVVVLALFLSCLHALYNEDVDRRIDLTTQNVRHRIRIVFKRSDAAERLVQYNFTLVPEIASIISSVTCYVDGGEEIPVYPPVLTGRNLYLVFPIDLPPHVHEMSSVVLSISLLLHRALRPLPSSISLTENQNVVYEDNAYFFSPYRTRSEKTVITCPNEHVISFTNIEPMTRKENKIKYGSYHDTPAQAFEKVQIHFRNNAPFVVATSLVREVEVSLWGNIAFTDSWYLHNYGARLKGGFSRTSYGIKGSNAPAVVSGWIQELPGEAFEVYLRDEIGNISSSHVHYHRESGRNSFQIEGRYMLFGGWNASYTSGWNLPLASQLSVDQNGRYVLNSSLFYPINRFPIEELTIRFIFPEGTENIRWDLPFPLSNIQASVHTRVTHLNLKGRPFLEIRMERIGVSHEKSLYISFDLATSNILKEPGLLFVALSFFMIICILVMQVDCRIHPGDGESTMALEKELLLLLGQVRQVCEECLKIRAHFVSLLGTSNVKSCHLKLEKALERAVDDLSDFGHRVNPIDRHAGHDIVQLSKLMLLQKTRLERLMASLIKYKRRGSLDGIERAQNSFRRESDAHAKQVLAIIEDLQ